MLELVTILIEVQTITLNVFIEPKQITQKVLILRCLIRLTSKQRWILDVQQYNFIVCLYCYCFVTRDTHIVT